MQAHPVRASWPPPPPRPHLSHGEVHVWAVDLDAPPLPAARLHACLSADERARRARYRAARDRRRYQVGRGTLRMILAMYLAVPPDTLRFAYGRRGKPSLQAPTAGIYFNVAHADRLFLCAVAGEPVLGIDVERVHPFDELDSLAETCFSAAELAIFQSLAGEHRTRAFFTGWTRKEAFIKAVGDGLGYPLDGFDVALGPDEVPRILAVRAEPTGASEWVLHALEPGEPYLAAVVAGPPANAVHCWFWQAATARDVVLSQRCCAGATDSPPGPVCD